MQTCTCRCVFSALRTLKIFLVAALVATVVRLLPFIFLECQSEHGDFLRRIGKGQRGEGSGSGRCCRGLAVSQ